MLMEMMKCLGKREEKAMSKGKGHRRKCMAALYGEWGERVAAERLRMEGMVIIERNSRPLVNDQRLEIDIIAYDPRSDTMVFVEVKQHSKHLFCEKRLRSIDERKRKNLRTACAAWRNANRWEGDCRFDVIEVFGTPETRRPEIDHIQHVYLHTPSIDSVEWI